MDLDVWIDGTGLEELAKGRQVSSYQFTLVDAGVKSIHGGLRVAEVSFSLPGKDSSAAAAVASLEAEREREAVRHMEALQDLSRRMQELLALEAPQ